MENNKGIYQQVHDHYGTLARGVGPSYSSAIAQAFGYTQEELNSIPSEANLGVSCGNPLAITSLHEGETVIDLGCGAGFDVFLAAQKVGPSGRAIGVDMNQDMLARAYRNQAKSPAASNVSFVEARITSIPLQDGIANCIISNCVINLVPEDEKPMVFAEMARLLLSGGRVAISDILARKPLPSEVRQSVALYVGCVAGASTKDDYTRWLTEAGFSDVTIVDANSDLNIYMDMEKDAQAAKQAAATSCCKASGAEIPSSPEGQRSCTQHDAAGAGCSEDRDKAAACCDRHPPGHSANVEQQGAVTQGTDDPTRLNLNEWAGSFKIFAVKK